MTTDAERRRDGTPTGAGGARAGSGRAPSGPRYPAACELVGASTGMRDLRRQLRQVARTRSTVLLLGETGTGKGHAARLLHASSTESAEPFVHVDCASLAPSVIESELFGHERGAFTGASDRRVGRLERAGTGTVFLDEIGEVAPEVQAKLLRVLQDREFERVGGTAPRRLVARVVAATNRDLRREIEAGRFRADLYYRLQVFELRLPPLRERLADLDALVRAALERVRALDDGPGPAIDDGFVVRLRMHAWPGNVRELQNVVERLAIAKPAGPWTASDADAALAGAPGLVGAGRDVRREPAEPGDPVDSRTRFEAAERNELARTLRRHRWNVSAAARSLGVSRGALRGRMARLGLS